MQPACDGRSGIDCHHVCFSEGRCRKTTLLTHLAVAAEAAGDGPVGVVDCDQMQGLARRDDARGPSPPSSPGPIMGWPQHSMPYAKLGAALQWWTPPHQSALRCWRQSGPRTWLSCRASRARMISGPSAPRSRQFGFAGKRWFSR